jgi:polar amino acid transport system substrate-binding protein
MNGLMKSCLLVGAFAVAAVSATAASAETTLERIQRTKKLTVATEAAYPPMEYIENGKIVGMGKELLDEVAKDLGVQVQQIDLPFQGILPGLIAQKFDLVATSVGINAERAKRYAYTMPVAENSAYIVSKAGSSITSAADLDGKVVATQLASSQEPIARRIDQELKAKGSSGFTELKLFPSFNDCFLSVANGTAEAALAPLPVINNLMASRGGIFKLGARAVEQPTYVAWAVRPDDKDLRDAINKTFLRLQQSGKLAELQQKWLKTTYPLPTSNYLPEGAI